MKKKSSKTAKPRSLNPDVTKRILNEMLAQAPFDGWTETAYAAALQETGATRDEAAKYFPHGIRDVIEAFGEATDEAMLKRIESERGFDRMRVRDKVTFGVRALLEELAPHREAMRRLTIWYALPHHAGAAIKRISKTVDKIWIAAGDSSTDYNFYTKRILLAGVFKTTLLFWLGDDTPDHQATRDFLDRRIADVMKLSKSISLMKEFKPSEIVDMLKDKVRKFV